MKSKAVAVAVVLILVLFSLSSCSERLVRQGFDNWNENVSSLDLASSALLERQFLIDYPYKDGDFRYERYNPVFFSMGIERIFIWLTYDDVNVYQDAKQSRLDRETDVIDNSLNGTEAFGFTFSIVFDFSYRNGSSERKTEFPYWYTAFGFNDETKTLVFLGYSCSIECQKKEKPYIDLVKTDFSAYLTHYYGDWFDWEAGVGYTASETTAD